MNIKQLTFPTNTFLSLAEAKAQLRVTVTSEDSLINDSINAAVSQVESYTALDLQSKTFVAYFDEGDFNAYGLLELWKYPISEITSIKYLDQNGTEQTLSSSTYSTDISDCPARILLTDIPTTKLNTLNTWRIYFTCGFTNRDEVHAELVDWVKKFTADSFNIRQSVFTGVPVNITPYDYKQALDKFRKDVR